jgi:hypothetical protein
MKATVDGADAQGKATHTEQTSMFDGKPSAIKGAPDANTTRVYRRIDGRTYEYVQSVAGKLTTTARTVIAADGKTRTITTTGKNAQGQTVKNVAFYDRQQRRPDGGHGKALGTTWFLAVPCLAFPCSRSVRLAGFVAARDRGTRARGWTATPRTVVPESLVRRAYRDCRTGRGITRWDITIHCCLRGLALFDDDLARFRDQAAQTAFSSHGGFEGEGRWALGIATNSVFSVHSVADSSVFFVAYCSVAG